MKKWTWFRSGARLLVLVLATSIIIFNLVPVAAGDVEDLVVQGLGPDDPIPPRHLYAVTQDGRLLVYVDNSSDTAANWIAQAVATPGLQGINWATFTNIFAGGDGILYAIDAEGSLHYFRLLDPWRNSVQMSWSADSNTIIGGTGWNGIPAVGFSRLAFGQGQTGRASSSLVRAIWSTNGAFYQHGWKANGLVEPDFSKWTHQGNGREAAYYGPTLPGPYTGRGYETFEGGGGITYAIDGSGNLLRFHIHPDGQWVNPSGQLVGDAAAQPLQIGTGWSTFKFVTASLGEYSIEGYVSTAQPVPNTSPTIAPMSVAPGATVKVRASTFSPSYTVRLLRLERHTQDDTGTPSGLIDGMKIGRTRTLRAPAGGNFKKPENFNMFTSGAGWGSDGADIALPMGAQPGIYAAELTTPSGGRYLAPFVVKPRGGKPANNIAVIANVSTWNAYNQWGGSSRYFSWVHPELQDTAGQPPIDLSYERPLLETPPNDGAIPAVGLINRDPRAANHLVRAEVWVNTWLDSLAAVNPKYAYDVYSDIDLNQGIANLAQHKLLILTTHPEYWSDNMRTNLEAYLNAGGHLIYIAGNGLYDRVTITDAGNMRLQRGLGGNCPGGPNSPNPCPPRDLFRYASPTYPNGRSERAVLGLAYETFLSFVGLGVGKPYTVVNSNHAFFSGTGLAKGSLFGEIQGLNYNLPVAAWEVGQYQPNCQDFPFGDCTTSHSILVGNVIASDDIASDDAGSDIVYHTTGSGSGWIFSAASIPFGGVLAIDPTLQRIVQNALDSAIADVAP